MGMSAAVGRRALSDGEFDPIRRMHRPAIRASSRERLGNVVRRLREQRDWAPDISRRQRRELRGEAEPRGTAPAVYKAGAKFKPQALAGAVKRANGGPARHARADKRARVPHHPTLGRTASEGARPVPIGPRAGRADTA